YSLDSSQLSYGFIVGNQFHDRLHGSRDCSRQMEIDLAHQCVGVCRRGCAIDKLLRSGDEKWDGDQHEGDNDNDGPLPEGSGDDERALLQQYLRRMQSDSSVDSVPNSTSKQRNTVVEAIQFSLTCSTFLDMSPFFASTLPGTAFSDLIVC